jgi:sulfatase modifying factor 1
MSSRTPRSRFAPLTGLLLVTACTSPDRQFSSPGDGGSSGNGSLSSNQSGKGGSGNGGNGLGGFSAAGRAGANDSGGSGGAKDSGGSGGANDSGGSGGADAGQGGMAPIDPCLGVVCETPPAASCTSAQEYRSYDQLGSCSDGTCSYAEHLIACTCQGKACTSDPCATIKCETPPAAVCADANNLTTYSAMGSCNAGSCSYMPKNTLCEFGCASAACKPDPCIGVTCSSPPAATCKNGNTKTTYAASGTCAAGKCSYQPSDTPCPSNQACSGQGMCALCNTDASCGAGCTACGGSTPKCKGQSNSSSCVGCLSNGDCSDPTPVCNTSNNTCQARPSCSGLAKTCGASGNQDCCASGVVTGNTFNRGNDPAYPAKVANFRLDNYEVTVGRFRKFVGVYAQNMIASGAGKNPNNSSDTGWNTAWNSSLPASAADLKSSLTNCISQWATWTDTPGSAAAESLPIDCVSWFQAEAFCIWDGGRLPTEAEWNYAAAGGTAQRNYPWGGTAPDCSYANFATDSGNCVMPSGGPNRVGSESPTGNGVFGQADLAGNIEEWVQDWFVDPYPSPSNCNNCANLGSGMYRVARGGHSKAAASVLITSYRDSYTPTTTYDYLGIRCARAQ